MTAFKISLVVGSFLFLSQASFAELATTIDGSCRIHKQDEFDHGWRLNGGSKKFAGKCINSTGDRPVVVLSNTNDELTFANVFHEGQFWSAQWSKADIPTVRFVIIYFDVDIPVLNYVLRPAHTELHFKFPQGLLLTSHATGEKTYVQDLSISWEAALPFNVKYDFLVGIRKNYGIVGRAVSVSRRLQENTDDSGKMRKTLAYDLRLRPQEARAIFEKSLQDSHKSEMKEFYLTISNNCTTKPFNIIDSVLKKTRGYEYSDIEPFITVISIDPIAHPSWWGLHKRKLITLKQKPIKMKPE